MPRFQLVNGLTARVFAEKSQDGIIDTMISLIPSLAEAKGNDPSVANGVCAAMSALWIQRRARGSAFWDGLESNESLAEIKQLQHKSTEPNRIIAASYGEINHGGDIGKTLGIQMMMQQTGMIPTTPLQIEAKMLADKQRDVALGHIIAERTGLALSHTPNTQMGGSGSPGSLGEKLIQNGEGFQWIAFNFTDTKGKGGGHAVAVHITTEGVTFMDPNHGEIDFRNAQSFAHWFDKYHLRDYGAVNDFQIDRFDHSAPLDRFKDGEMPGSTARELLAAMEVVPTFNNTTKSRKRAIAVPKAEDIAGMQAQVNQPTVGPRGQPLPQGQGPTRVRKRIIEVPKEDEVANLQAQLGAEMQAAEEANLPPPVFTPRVRNRQVRIPNAADLAALQENEEVNPPQKDAENV